ncbi:GH15110 [Drosophila grimshawi]|uniref:GH15110 n=2 Tax=Drosophila grimshawi TaxID=7222 RepID=B4IYR9_DROGR|nr:GH15110 [Drosophila grimshawi]
MARQTQWQLRQRFLMDLLLQVHKPLLQQELIEMGSRLNENPSDYEADSWPSLIDFMERVHQGRILRPYSIYSQLQEELPQQLLGVYRFLLLAKDWRTFQCNACYARSHFNPVLFVNALQLAISGRPDTKDLVLPAMHEVLPQLYFDKDVILDAQQVNWQQLAPIPNITLKRSWKEILGDIVYPRRFRQPLEVPVLPAEPIVIEVKPLRTLLSSDVELNGYWNSLISRLLITRNEQGTAIIDGDRMMAFRNAHDEYMYRLENGRAAKPEHPQILLHNIKQFVALCELEELTTGHKSLQLIEPTLMTTGGVRYKATKLNGLDVWLLIRQSTEELQSQIDKQLEKAVETPTMETVGQVIATNYWQLFRHLSLAINGNCTMEPNLLGMATSNLRDPIYRTMLFQLAQLIARYERPQVSAYDNQQVQQIHVGNLTTYEHLVDSDLINLMDQQLLQTQRNNLQFLQRRLVARQLRLNHKPFNITYELYASEPMVVLIRSYLIPPGRDQAGLLIESFVSELAMGKNILVRQFPMAKSVHTLRKLYEAKKPLDSSNACSFPQHLLLPRGTAEGLRLQLLVQVLAWNGSETIAECEWAGSVVDSTAPVLTSARVDVVIHHHSLKLKD